MYYLSGLLVIKYSGTPKKIQNVLGHILSAFDAKSYVRVIHVIEEDYYFDSIGKRFTDIVDGPVKSPHILF
jgi:hypothetical protein